MVKNHMSVLKLMYPIVLRGAVYTVYTCNKTIMSNKKNGYLIKFWKNIFLAMLSQY